MSRWVQDMIGLASEGIDETTKNDEMANKVIELGLLAIASESKDPRYYMDLLYEIMVIANNITKQNNEIVSRWNETQKINRLMKEAIDTHNRRKRKK